MNQPTLLSDDFLIPEARQMENINENVFPQYQGQEFHDRDLEINTNLIQLFPDDVVGLLNLFEPTLENLTTSIKYIFRSPFNPNHLYNIVKIGTYLIKKILNKIFKQLVVKKIIQKFQIIGSSQF